MTKTVAENTAIRTNFLRSGIDEFHSKAMGIEMTKPSVHLLLEKGMLRTQAVGQHIGDTICIKRSTHKANILHIRALICKTSLLLDETGTVLLDSRMM